MMPLKFVNKENQTFDLGRTISFVVCSDCQSDFVHCTNFMNCPHNNYEPEKCIYHYTLQEFKDYYGDRIGIEPKWYNDDEMFEDFMNLFEFSGSLYFARDDKDILNLYDRDGEEWQSCKVDLSTGRILESEKTFTELTFDLQDLTRSISEAVMNLN